MFKYLISFLFFISLVGCKAKVGSVYTIAYDPLFADGHISERSGQMLGFFNDVISLLQKEGLRLKAVEVGPDALNFSLESKDADFIFSTMTPNDPNKVLFAFSLPLLEMGPVIVVSEDFKGRVQNHFRGRIMGVGTNAGSQISIVQTIPGVIIETFIHIAGGYEELAQNKIDGLLDLHFNAYFMVKNLYKDKLKIATKPLNDFGYRIVSRKENEVLLKFIEKKMPEIKKLREKWGFPT